MYCVACGAAFAPGLSYCNRCGVSLRESVSDPTAPVNSYLTAIALIGVAGLGFMLGGAIALRNGADFGEEMVGVYLLMTFIIIGVIELVLLRQLSRLSTSTERKHLAPEIPQPAMTEFRDSQLRAVAEPVPRVTESTTRTLEFSRREPMK